MDKEVDPLVLAVIDEKRLSGPRLTPVEIVARMGVFDAREKSADHAWLATGANVIATVWAEYVSVDAGGRWFCLESLDTQTRPGGGARTLQQAQRAKDRLALLKRTFDGGEGFRAVLQINRVAVHEMESSKNAKVSTRVLDDDKWHVATWQADEGFAILVRGPRGWVPSPDEVQAERRRLGAPEPKLQAPAEVEVDASPEAVAAAALRYVTAHFTGYGYVAKDVREQELGYDFEISNAKGVTLLKIAIKGTSAGAPGFRISSKERACSVRDPLWRLVVVAGATGPEAQHTIYKPSEMEQAPGYQAAE